MNDILKDYNEQKQAQIELSSILEQDESIKYLFLRALKKYDINKDNWLESWLIRKVTDTIKNDEKLANHLLRICSKYNMGVSRSLVEDTATKLVQERLYNDNKLSYEKDDYE